MESKSDKQFVEPLLKLLRKFQNNNRCLYPGCPKQPIGSHVIAESVLEQLADNEGKVITWDVSDNDMLSLDMSYPPFSVKVSESRTGQEHVLESKGDPARYRFVS